MPGFILASASPRRRELLAAAGFQFRVVTAGVEEVEHNHGDPAVLAEGNARLKAEAVAALHPGAVVLGADTVVVVGEEILHKPGDRDEAAAMLAKLSGRGHRVITGVCLVRAGEDPEAFHVSSLVTFGPLDPEAIARYHQMVDPMDKAGAYALQEYPELLGAQLVGSHTNVVGLPMEEVGKRLARRGVAPAG